ncbi:Uncharacterised protein [Mycoplasmopsis edwardii]|uniref:Uncharacterized protein n=1 Tax=Mycoplasmopsis edwardii TaxID=53558 RepID=A0A3B0PJ40_9BACT|nr:Uncharacterised protein [Mycoplasmopsis edwardii]
MLNGKYVNINPYTRTKDVVLDTETNEYDPIAENTPKAQMQLQVMKF